MDNQLILNIKIDHGKNQRAKIYSCAIFGEPGSGKSFIAEELIKVLEKKTGRKISKPITYNLTQFNDQKSLIDAFKEIQEHVLKGEIAFVIWDEFDTYYNNNKCGWLPSFLMPMQDSKFFDGKKNSDLGKCIFFFVGGTFNNEDEFIQWTIAKHNEKLKGRDFHSRLDSSLTVIRIDVLVNESFCVLNQTSEARTLRALMIRNFLKDYTTVTDISKGVLIYLLHVPLQYGIRSLDKIIKNSEFQHASTFEIKHLPSIHTLKLHVKSEEGWEEDIEKFLNRFLTKEQYEETLRLEWRSKTKYEINKQSGKIAELLNFDDNDIPLLENKKIIYEKEDKHYIEGRGLFLDLLRKKRKEKEKESKITEDDIRSILTTAKIS